MEDDFRSSVEQPLVLAAIPEICRTTSERHAESISTRKCSCRRGLKHTMVADAHGESGQRTMRLTSALAPQPHRAGYEPHT